MTTKGVGLWPAPAGSAVARWAALLQAAGHTEARRMLIGVVRRIAIGTTTIVIDVHHHRLRLAIGLVPASGEAASDDRTDDTPLTVEVPFRLAPAGKQVKLVIAGEDGVAGLDSPLTRLIVRAYAARTIWLKARGRDDAEIAARRGDSRAYLRTLL